MACGVSIVRNQCIPRILARNSMESHTYLVEGMEIDMHNLDNGMVKPILLNLKENSQPKISASNDSNVSILNREEIERLHAF